MDRLRRVVGAAPQTTEELFPLVTAWFASSSEHAPSASGSLEDPPLLWTVEVGFQTGSDADAFPVDPPDGLSPAQPWFWIGFVRYAPRRATQAVVLWFVPVPALHALREHERWDTGNALGFDFVATEETGPQRLLAEPLLQETLAAFAGLEVAAVELPD